MRDPLLWRLATEPLAETAYVAALRRSQRRPGLFRMPVYLVFRIANEALSARTRRPGDPLSLGIPADKAVAWDDQSADRGDKITSLPSLRMKTSRALN